MLKPELSHGWVLQQLLTLLFQNTKGVTQCPVRNDASFLQSVILAFQDTRDPIHVP